MNALGQTKDNPNVRTTRARMSQSGGVEGRPPSSLRAALTEKPSFLLAVAMIFVVSLVVLRACAVLLPARWLIDWDVRRDQVALSTRGSNVFARNTVNFQPQP